MHDLDSSIKEYIPRIRLSELGLEGKMTSSKLTGLPGSGSRLNYLLKINGKPFRMTVLWAGAGTKAFEGEFQKLKAIEQYGLSPKAYISDRDHLVAPFMITEQVDEQKIGKKDISQNLDMIIGSLNAMTRVDVSKLRESACFENNAISCEDFAYKLLKKTESRINEYAILFGNNMLSDILTHAVHHSRTYIQKCQDAFAGASLSLVNGNISERSIVYRDGKVMFTNWQDAQIGDPAYELSRFARAVQLNDEDKASIFKKYALNGNVPRRTIVYDELAKMFDIIDSAFEYDSCIRHGNPEKSPQAVEIKDRFKYNLEAFLQGRIAHIYNAKKLMDKAKPKVNPEDFLVKSQTRMTPFGMVRNSRASVWGMIKDNIKSAFKPRNIALGAALAASALGLAKQKYDDINQRLFDEHFNLIREITYEGYEYRLNPIEPNMIRLFNSMRKLKDKFGESAMDDLESKFAKKGIRYICYGVGIPGSQKKVESCFAGRIKDTFYKDGIKITLAESSAEDFEGILPLEIKGLNRIDAFCKQIAYTDGTQEIVIDPSLIMKNAKQFQSRYSDVLANHKFCLQEPGKCDAGLEAIYETIKGGNMVQKFYDADIETILLHEIDHSKNPNYGEEASEMSALLKQVSDSSTPLGLSKALIPLYALKGSLNPIYESVSRPIIDCYKSESGLDEIGLIKLPLVERKRIGYNCRDKLMRK